MAPISANEKPQKNFRSTSSASARRLGLAQALSNLRIADSTEFAVVYCKFHVVLESRNFELAAALQSPAAPRVVDNQAAHDASGIAHESVSIGEGGAVLVREFKICLVQERRGA